MVDVKLFLAILIEDVEDFGNRVEISEFIILQELIELGCLDFTLPICQCRNLISRKVRIDDLGHEGSYSHLSFELFERYFGSSMLLVDELEDFFYFFLRNFEVGGRSFVLKEVEVWSNSKLLKKPLSLSALRLLAFLIADIFLLFIALDLVVTWSMNSLTLLMLSSVITAIWLMFSVTVSMSDLPGLLLLFTLKAFVLRLIV